MKTTLWLFTPAARAACAAAGLLVLDGCRGEHSPGDAEEHVGHVIPAHKPKAFPEAVRRLRELNDQLSRNRVPPQPGSLPGDKTLHIALDIANWLPEIAADSDLPETPWNEVNSRSEALVADYRAILAGAPTGDTPKRLENAGVAIAGLESVLAAADPKWFSGPEKPGEAQPEGTARTDSN
jgi:hypothetical protein